jgi:hypothetical protein
MKPKKIEELEEYIRVREREIAWANGEIREIKNKAQGVK